MLPDRQKTLLTILTAIGGEASALEFQKLLFLYCHELQRTPSYDFVPYRFGGFSFTSYADKRKLIKQGYLANEEHCWRITRPRLVSKCISTERRKLAQQLLGRYAKLKGTALVVETYRRYPYYAIRSEIAEKLLSADPSALAAIKSAVPEKRRPGVVTLGYESRSIESYLNSLIQNGVTLLCDVRRNPISRKYGFSKNTLAGACSGVGVVYQHLPTLGIASEERRELKTKADYDALFSSYRRDALPLQTAALTKIRDWVVQGDRVALTCFERFHEHCHRHCVADELENRFGSEYSPAHL